MLTRPPLNLTLFYKLFGNSSNSAWLISPDLYASERELAESCENNFFLPTLKNLYLHALPSDTYLSVLHGYLKVHRTEILVLDTINFETVKRFAGILRTNQINVLAIDNLDDDSVKYILDILTRIALKGRAIVLKCGVNISHHLVVDINDYNATTVLAYKCVVPAESSTAAIYRQFSPPPDVLISTDPTIHRQIILHSAEHDAAIAKAQQILSSTRPSILASPYRQNPFVLPQIDADSTRNSSHASHAISPFSL
jgi:hypothetical protein